MPTRTHRAGKSFGSNLALKSLAEVLQTNAVSCKLCVGREVNSGSKPRLKLLSAISALEEGYSVQVVSDARGAANQIAEETA